MATAKYYNSYEPTIPYNTEREAQWAEVEYIATSNEIPIRLYDRAGKRLTVRFNPSEVAYIYTKATRPEEVWLEQPLINYLLTVLEFYPSCTILAQDEQGYIKYAEKRTSEIALHLCEPALLWLRNRAYDILTYPITDLKARYEIALDLMRGGLID